MMREDFERNKRKRTAYALWLMMFPCTALLLVTVPAFAEGPVLRCDHI